MTQRVELLAPAKINLGLEILRRRPDGYHDLNTIFASLSIGDRILLSPRGDRMITCEVRESDLPGDESNLAVRAALRLRERLGKSEGLHIEITKALPVGAGLGGGSSDAAAVLMGAPVIWGFEPPAELLQEIALELGSDVPFFLLGGIALAGSRGEVLKPVAIELPWHVLLVNPGIHVSTPKAFAAVGREGERPATDLVASLDAGLSNQRLLREALVNDFEEAVFAMHPELARIKRSLYASGALFSLMSGSGSTVYGLFERREEALEAQQRFTTEWCAVCEFLGPGPQVRGSE
jgi:4-diphosphocytidyl-2-C-methyl-D-erythritol kinase